MKKIVRGIQSNNRGAGLPSVIIAIAFIAIMGSILLTVSYTNYNMKQTNYKTKDSFYSAEQALDEISVGLQNVISNAVSDAYQQVLANYSAYDVDKKMDLMESLYFTTIWNALEETGSNHQRYDLAKIQAYLSETAWTGDYDNGYGAIVTSTDNEMVTYDNSGVVLKNIEIYFRDDLGYVSVIHTDIRLVLPDLTFASNTVLPDISEFIIIADDKLTFGNVGTNLTNGEIYAGSLEATGLDPLTPINIQLTNIAQFVIKQDIDLKNANFSAAEEATIWANDLVADSSNVQIAGTLNLSDDLNIKGVASLITIGNSYNGYGNSLDDATKSSAILVNGTDALLDLHTCGIVTIAGHAYVGTTAVNLGESGTGAERGADVYTGESISVKSNQLLYLVPAECIGVMNATGLSVYGKNPLTASEYQMIVSNASSYTEIDVEKTVSKLGASLKDFIKYDVYSEPDVEKVFVTTNSETLVYYYMKFSSENAANSYFQAYYNNNSDMMTDYMDFYTNGIRIADPTYMLRMQLAGNMIKYDEATHSSMIQKNTLTNASEKLESTSTTYEQMKDAYCTKLVFSYADLINIHETDLNQNIVFENIIDVASFQTFVNTYANGLFGGANGYLFTESGGTVKALLIDNASMPNPFIYNAPSGSDMEDVNLIIATGDVLINSDFHGLLIVNGEVSLANNIRVISNDAYVKRAMRATTTEGGVDYTVINFLWDGTDFINDDESGNTGTTVRLSDLVVFENWTKD